MQAACLKCSLLSGRMRLYSDALKGANEPEGSLQGRGEEVMRLRILISPEMRPLTSTALHGAFIVTDDLRAEGFDQSLIIDGDTGMTHQCGTNQHSA